MSSSSPPTIRSYPASPWISSKHHPVTPVNHHRPYPACPSPGHRQSYVSVIVGDGVVPLHLGDPVRHRRTEVEHVAGVAAGHCIVAGAAVDHQYCCRCRSAGADPVVSSESPPMIGHDPNHPRCRHSHRPANPERIIARARETIPTPPTITSSPPRPACRLPRSPWISSSPSEPVRVSLRRCRSARHQESPGAARCLPASFNVVPSKQALQKP